MFGRVFNFKLILSVIFLFTTVFPSQLFSAIEPVAESMDYKGATYEKVRCPQCGMEFYYVPGKEGPHSHWVHYEIPEDDIHQDKAENAEIIPGKEQQKNLMSSLTKKDIQRQQLGEAPSDKDFAFPGLQKEFVKRYELRQKLTCPYDGYSFFPEGDVIEDIKLMRTSLILEGMSVVEKSFAKAIPFGVSKELKQFGYDLFLAPTEEKEKEEEIIDKRTKESFGALGMLKAVFKPEAVASTFSAPSSISQTAVIPVGPDYILGPGDMLVINIWGSVQESFPVEIDREGKIILPKAGPLYLWGLKFQEAEDRIRERLNNFYTNFNVDVSMGKIRDIQVSVLGEVKNPGLYAINSHSLITQALYAAGGPTKLGSLRKIKIIHADGKKENMDLYPYLLEGEMEKLTKVISGDTIFVSTLGKVSAVTGNVKRPAIYEMKNDMSLADLLNFAGGITPIGDLQRIQLERIEGNEKRVMLDIELRHSDLKKFSLQDFILQDGDLVIVSPIVRLKHDFVSILGNVERPGDYGLSKNMKITDLLKMAKGLMPSTYLERAEIARVTEDRTRQIIPVNLDKIILGTEEDIFLNEWDILFIYSEAEVQPRCFVEIEGAVNKPGRYELTPGMKISDLLFKGGGVKPNEIIRGAELFHNIMGEQPIVREIETKRLSYAQISVDKDIILSSGDVLFVKSEPSLTTRKAVTLEGQVRFPGVYSIKEGERISSVLERAGGFTNEAFLDGAFFTRKSIKEAQEKMRERFLEKENRTLLEEQQAILLRSSTSGIIATSAESLNTRKEMLEFIESVKIEGRLVIKLLPIEELKLGRYDILLEDGDALMVPQTPSAVTLIGSVNNPISVPFEESKGLEYYISKAGGLTKHADKSGIYVIRANGEAVSKFMVSKGIKRGDTIIVPQELKYWTPPGTLLKETVEILSRIAIGVGIIAALNN